MYTVCQCYQIWESQGGTSLVGLYSWKGKKEESEFLPVTKTSLVEEHLKGGVGQNRRGTGTRMLLCEVYKTGFCIFI